MNVICSVKAPTGYNGIRYYDHGAGDWLIGYRPKGSDTWIYAGRISGTTKQTPAELEEVAAATIRRHIKANA